MSKISPLGNPFHFKLGMVFSGLFTIVCLVESLWANALVLGALFVSFAVGIVLMEKGLKRAAMHVVVAAMILQQFVVLYLYRDTPNIGLIWFLIVPSIVASMGRPVDILIWTPFCLAAMLLSYLHVRDLPVMSHPMTLPNIIGAISFMAIVSYRFVSERMLREQQLTQALESARSAEQRSTRFLASLSHELRTPMTGIVLSSEMLKESGSFKAEDQQSIERLNRSALVTANLLNDVLELAKVEAGIVTLERAPFRIEELLDEIRMTLLPLSDDHGLVFEIYVPPECPSHWVSSAVCIRQILSNLIGNAIKYTLQGRVTVSISVDPHWVDFLVTDTGSGIEQSQQAHIFDPFVSLSEVSSAGTGLGLTLARGYAQALKCELDLIRSDPGDGSQFRLRIPKSEYRQGLVSDAYGSRTTQIAVVKNELTTDEGRQWVDRWLAFWGVTVSAEAEQVITSTFHGSIVALADSLGLELDQPLPQRDFVPPVTVAPVSVLRRCLVCDDNELIREVFALHLNKLGYETLTACDHQETMARLGEGSISFLLLDVQLGDESGIEILAAIRGGGQAYCDIPVCMISGSLMAKDEAVALGADEYLLKPTQSSELADVAEAMTRLAQARGILQ